MKRLADWSPKAKTRLAWVVLAVWFIALSAFLFYWRFLTYGVFDEQSLWLDKSPEAVALTGNQVLHVRSGCFCDMLAAKHQASIDDFARYQQRQVSPEEVETLGIPVPATPMLVVVEQGTVVYAGPYASGPACSIDNSFIPTILADDRQMTTPWYNGIASACRCPNN